jgi:CheY-like chemotaxis protein
MRNAPRLDGPVVSHSSFSLSELPKPAANTLFDFSWPTAVLCGLSAGFLCVAAFGDTDAFFRSTKRVHELLTFTRAASQPDRAKVLVVTTNPKDGFTIAATLAPRGFVALPARNLQDVLTQIQTHAGAIHLTVLDATMPDYNRIARAVRKGVPPDRIVVLHASPGVEAVAPLILEHL